MGVWLGSDATDLERYLVEAAANTAGVTLVRPASSETLAAFIRRCGAAGIERVRIVGQTPIAEDHEVAAEVAIHLTAQPVLGSGRVELLHYVREQAISTTLHRFGNLVR